MNPWLERLRHAPQEDAPSASDAENGQDDQRDIIAVKVWSEILGAAIWVVVDDLPRDQWPTDDPVYEYAEVKRLIGRGADALRSVHLVKMVFAARQAGRSEIEVELEVGSKRDAILYTCWANKHGRPLTSADKRRTVTRLVADSEWGHWSNVEIARHCGVAHSFVAKVRRSLDSGQSDEGPRTYRTKHGTTATMDVSHIGRATQGRMTSAPTPDDVPSVPEDQTAPNEVGAVSASETTLVVKEVHRGLAHYPDRFVLKTRPKLTDVLVPSTIAPASTSLGSDLRAHLPSPEPEVGTDAVTSIVRLMDELAAALRRLDTEAPMTACQVWSPQLLDRCVQSSSKLMKHLHALQGAVYPPYLEMMGAREAEGGDLHVPASSVGAATVDSHDGVPSVAEGTLGKEEGMLPSDAEKSTEGGLSLVNGPDSHRSPVDQRRWAWERAKALEAEGRSPAEIAQRLNAAEGGRRWNHGSVLVLLRANISKVSAAY